MIPSKMCDRCITARQKETEVAAAKDVLLFLSPFGTHYHTVPYHTMSQQASKASETASIVEENTEKGESSISLQKECFDFRDVLQHPPAATSVFTPLPNDPAWEAHRVYFNERPLPQKRHGDAFDVLWQHETPQLEFEQLLHESKQPDNSLDPLGWPLAVPDFSYNPHKPNKNVSLGNLYPFRRPCNDDNSDDEDCDNDDLNLLKQAASDQDAASVFLTMDESTQQQAFNISGVEMTYQTNQTLALAGYRIRETTPSKAQRIEQYQTTGVDEESSVESSNHDESDEEQDSDNVEYVPQLHGEDNDEDEEEDVMGGFAGGESDNVLADFACFDAKPHPTVLTESVESLVTTPMAQLDIQDNASPKTNILSSGDPSSDDNAKAKDNVTRIPLLRPPPPEKLAAWKTLRLSNNKSN